MNNKKGFAIRSIVYIGVLAGLYILLKPTLFPDKFLRLTYIPTALGGILLGPWLGGLATVIGDVLAHFIFPAGGFFIGYTITAFLRGVAYGLFLYKLPAGSTAKLVRYTLAILVVCVGLNILLNGFWIALTAPDRAISWSSYIGFVLASLPTNITILLLNIVTLPIISYIADKVNNR